jgi:hypothetical protein
VVRLVRAVTILERIGSSEAMKLWFRIARGGGVPAERATDALVRMKDREKLRPANQPQRTIVQGDVAEAKPSGR